MIKKNHFIFRHNIDGSCFLKFRYDSKLDIAKIYSLTYDNDKKDIKIIDFTQNLKCNNVNYSYALFRLLPNCFFVEEYFNIKLNKIVSSNLFFFNGESTIFINNFLKDDVSFKKSLINKMLKLKNKRIIKKEVTNINNKDIDFSKAVLNYIDRQRNISFNF